MGSIYNIWKVISFIDMNYGIKTLITTITAAMTMKTPMSSLVKLPEFSEVTFSISGSLVFHVSKRT